MPTPCPESNKPPPAEADCTKQIRIASRPLVLMHRCPFEGHRSARLNALYATKEVDEEKTDLNCAHCLVQSIPISHEQLVEAQFYVAKSAAVSTICDMLQPSEASLNSAETSLKRVPPGRGFVTLEFFGIAEDNQPKVS